MCLREKSSLKTRGMGRGKHGSRTPSSKCSFCCCGRSGASAAGKKYAITLDFFAELDPAAEVSHVYRCPTVFAPTPDQRAVGLRAHETSRFNADDTCCLGLAARGAIGHGFVFRILWTLQGGLALFASRIFHLVTISRACVSATATSCGWPCKAAGGRTSTAPSHRAPTVPVFCRRASTA